MSQRFGVPVTITNLRYTVTDAPAQAGGRVAAAGNQDRERGRGRGPLTLLGETKELDDVEVNSPTVDQDALSMMTAWVKPQSGAQPFSLRQLKLKNVRLSLTAVQLPPFDADIRMVRRDSSGYAERRRNVTRGCRS